MSFVTKTLKGSAIDVGSADVPASLDDLLWPECGAAILRRQTPKNIHTWLDGLNPEVLPRGRVILPLEKLAQTVGHLCDMSGLPAGPERDWLEKDIVSLAASFSGLAGAKFLRLRLDVVTTNACRKFHIDAIKARLVCTYRGTGTQYGISTDDADPKHVFTVQTGSPILLRGTLWPQQRPSGILHRSPPIEGTGETRLVLVLDPVDDPDEDI